jgi:tetraacyldisaccharide 4'-kinase
MNFFLLFFSMLWRFGYLIDSKTRLAPKKKMHFKTPLIGIGSLLAGGAGKTPYTVFLAKDLRALGLNVAILCKNTGDENLWLKKKGFEVFTGERFELCKKLDGKYDILISDDGLEDRRLSHAFWICLTWGERAKNLRDIIPCGNCRSLWRDHPEIACVKKCAMEWENEAKTADVVFCMEKPKNYYGEILPENSEIIAIAGIASSHRFFEGLQKNYTVTKKIKCKDHSKNIQKKAIRLLKLGLPVIITEKDSVKLSKDVLLNRNIFVTELTPKNSTCKKKELMER